MFVLPTAVLVVLQGVGWGGGEEFQPDMYRYNVQLPTMSKKFPTLLRKHSEVHFSNCCCKTFWRKSGKSRFPLQPVKLE